MKQEQIQLLSEQIKSLRIFAMFLETTSRLKMK